MDKIYLNVELNSSSVLLCGWPWNSMEFVHNLIIP